MSLRLKRSAETLVVATLTLTSLMLVLFPAVTEAQTKVKSEAQSSSSIVVRPGDSLWSITSERLGPNSSPRRIAIGVERLYAHNRGRIGADPNLILVDQVLSLPPMGEQSRERPPAKVTPAPEATKPVAARPTGRGGKSETERATSTTRGEVGSKTGKVPDPVTKPKVTRPVVLPDLPGKQVTPELDSALATGSVSPVEVFGRAARSLFYSATSAVVGPVPQDDRLFERRLLGLGIIALTLLIAVLIVWKLPMRRITHWDDEVWGIPTGYQCRVPATHRNIPFAPRPGSPGDREEARREEAPETFRQEKQAVATGSGDTPAANVLSHASVTISVATARRAHKPKASPRNGLALGTHNPEVRRISLRARDRVKAQQTPRPRRRTPFVLGARS